MIQIFEKVPFLQKGYRSPVIPPLKNLTSTHTDAYFFPLYRNEYQIFKKIIALDYEFPSGFPEVPKGLVQSLLVSIIFISLMGT